MFFGLQRFLHTTPSAACHSQSSFFKSACLLLRASVLFTHCTDHLLLLLVLKLLSNQCFGCRVLGPSAELELYSTTTHVCIAAMIHVAAIQTCVVAAMQTCVVAAIQSV